MAKNKYFLKCKLCNNEIASFKEWFKYNQRCPECGSNQADVIYNRDYTTINRILSDALNDKSMWKYFEFLPLVNKDNIVSCGEGDVAIDRWNFLEKYAKDKYNLTIEVYAHRQDNNNATGTFKDLAGSMIASVLKENGVKNYVVASTGNIAVACSRYLSDAGITLYAFIPKNSSKSQEAEISCFGEKVIRVDGDYTKTKEIAKEFADKHNFMLAAGNFDPMRIEAKKTMAYEWMSRLNSPPTVYIQGLSGGTGPLGVIKCLEEMAESGEKIDIPRFLMVQATECAPMAQAWSAAKKNDFPDGWENNFPIIRNPETSIATLATGYPKTYPKLAPIIKESNGEIIDFPGTKASDIAKLVAFETSVRIGPAAAVPIGGFIKSLKEGYINDGDSILINVGEGIRRAPSFAEKLIIPSSMISDVNECKMFSRADYKESLYNILEKIVESF
jgi:threonine synthase